MADKIPLFIENGRIQQFGTGDTISTTIAPGGGGGGGGGDAGWEVVASWSGASAISELVTPTLTDYGDIVIVAKDVVNSTAGWRAAQFSLDNGATWRNAVGDYIRHTDAGTVGTSDGAAYLHTTTSTSARSGSLSISAINATGIKYFQSGSENGMRSTFTQTGAINKIRVVPVNTSGVATGNMNSGTIVIYGRKVGGGGGGGSRTPPTLVQKIVVRGGGAFSLPSPPTPGNLLVMHATGFTSISVFGLAGFYFVGTYQSDSNNLGSCWARRVVSGDTGSYSVAATNEKQAVLYEYSGSNGVLPVFGGPSPIASGAFNIPVPFHPLVPEGDHLLALETDNSAFYTISPETGLDVDYATVSGVSGNHYAAMMRYRTGFDGTVNGTISGTPSAPYAGAFVVVGS